MGVNNLPKVAKRRLTLTGLESRILSIDHVMFKVNPY